MNAKSFAIFLLSFVAVFSFKSHASCGVAFCPVDTHAMAGHAEDENHSSLDVRFEYIHQDQPRVGSQAVGVGEIRKHHDEVGTINRNLITTYMRTFGPSWSASVTLPLVSRDHTHIHNHGGGKIVDRWSYFEMGDARLMVQHEMFEDIAVRLGAKVPTGVTNKADDTGSVAERTLQPGTGTTDLVAGVSYVQKLAWPHFSWFAQGQYHQAISTFKNFQPGHQIGADVGARYELGTGWDADLQLNLQYKAHDKGIEAEEEDSGGKFVSLSPGVSYAFGHHNRVYVYYQRPIHQYVSGVQLTADESYILGASVGL